VTDSADRLALADLAARYALAADRRDSALLVSLFAPDAVVVLPTALAGPGGDTRIAGHQAIGRLLEPLARFVRTRHTVSQQVPEFDGGTATAQTYGEAHHIYQRGDALHDRALTIRYLDAFARTEQGWRFTRRELVVDWLTDHPISTLD